MPPPIPSLPNSVAGSPLSPGSSPMMAPGAGDGQLTAMRAMIKALMDPLHKALGAAPLGSREYKALLRAINALQPVFGGAAEGNLQPAAAQQLMRTANAGASPLANVAPGLQNSPPPPKPAAAAPTAPLPMAA